MGGVAHFVKPEMYVQMIPPMLPVPLALVYVSGVFEILGGVGVLVERTRVVAGWGLIALLIAVFPANIYMALEPGVVEGSPDNPLIWWLRLPLQLVFVLWVVICTRRTKQTPPAEG